MTPREQRLREQAHTNLEHQMCLLYQELIELNPGRDVITLLTVLQRYRVHLTDHFFKEKDGE